MEGALTEAICQVMGITSTKCWTMLYRAHNGSGRAMALVIGDISCQALRTPGEWSCVITDTPENS